MISTESAGAERDGSLDHVDAREDGDAARVGAAEPRAMPATSASVRAAQAEASAALREVAEKGAETAEVVASRSLAAAQVAMAGMKRGIDGARVRIERERASWDELVASARLPALESGDPMGSLAERVEREATFWRAYALRASRPGAAHAIAIAAAVVALVGGAGIAALGGLRGLFGSDGSARELWAGAGALVLAVALAMSIAWWLHRTATHAAAEALLRSDASERSLKRVAAILALKSADDDAYREALDRLERG